MHICMDEAVISGPALGPLVSQVDEKVWTVNPQYGRRNWKKWQFFFWKKQASLGVKSLSHRGKRHSGLDQGGWTCIWAGSWRPSCWDLLIRSVTNLTSCSSLHRWGQTTFAAPLLWGQQLGAHPPANGAFQGGTQHSSLPSEWVISIKGPLPWNSIQPQLPSASRRPFFSGLRPYSVVTEQTFHWDPLPSLKHSRCC